MAWWEGADNHNIDGWESEAAVQRFAEQRLMPKLMELGITAEPRITFYAAHEVFAPRPVRETAT